MRQPPPIPESEIVTCLREQYDLHASSARYLPIGYDLNAFVYQVLTVNGTTYFVKLHTGPPVAASLLIPHLLAEAGIPGLLTPLPGRSQSLWCSLHSYSVTVYPFIHGDNAMNAGLSAEQWRAFGRTLQAIHSSGFASRLQGQIPTETFALPSARLAREMAARLKDLRPEGSAAMRLATFWRENAAWIDYLLERAENIGRQLQTEPWEFVLCHGDIHAANILVSDTGSIYLVDWDGPLLAPRERDLLFIVGSVIARRVLPHEEAWFFEGYGKVSSHRNGEGATPRRH